MLGRIIFCVVIAAAVLAVVLLATVSPLPRRSTGHSKAPPNLRTLTVYIHPTVPGTLQKQRVVHHEQVASVANALVFRHRMTAGPESTSRSLGAASGFLLPGEWGSAMPAFDTVHLEFDPAGLSGSLCVEAAGSKKPAPRGHRRRAGDGEETLRVVGGTGAFAFAFARGHAVLRAARGQRLGGGAAATALQLELSVAPAES